MKQHPLAGEKIVKVKVPGKPIKSWTGTKIYKERPDLHRLIRDEGLKLGDKRKFNLGTKKNPKWIGIHVVHPSEHSRAARQRLCPAGLRGKARETFIEEGLTFQEQRMAALPAVATAQKQSVERYRAAHPEEYASRTKARKERTVAKRKERGGIDYSKYYSPKHIAKAAGCSGLEVRKFLRKKNIGKRGGRYAFTKKEATRIVRALRKHLKEA